MKRSLSALFALMAFVTPALAQTRALPPGEIRANGDITFGNALKLGKREGNKTVITPDILQILGPGSTGDGSQFRVPVPGRRVAPTLAEVVGRTVDVADYRDPADGADWGPAFDRARQAISSTGGVIHVSTPGTLTISTPTTFPKGAPFILLRCDSQATTIKNADSLTTPMFVVGGPNAAGSSDFEVEGCHFTGANLTSSYAFGLENANTVTFRRAWFTNMTVGIKATASFALTLESIAANGVVNLFYSTTPAHNFTARRNRVYTGGTVYKFEGGNTDNISIVEGDYEHTGSLVETAGGTAMRVVGNYIEYFTAPPIVSTTHSYGVDISNNWIAFGQGAAAMWTLNNFVGGQIKRNSTYSQGFTFGAGTFDIETGDNVSAGGTVPPSPYRSPALLNGWVQQPGYATIGFRKASDGRVYLRGSLTNSTGGSGAAAFTLPPEYRPGTQRNFATSSSSGGTTTTNINGDGNVIIFPAKGSGTSGDPYQASLDGISFEPGT